MRPSFKNKWMKNEMKLNLRQALQMAIEFASKEDIRYFLMGVHVVKKDGDIKIESTCGHTAFQTRDVDHEFVIGDELDIIIPYSDVKLALKLPKSEELSLNGSMLGRIEFKPIDGIFPNLDEALNREGKNKHRLDFFSFNLDYATRASKALKVVHKHPIPRITFGTADGRIDITYPTLENTAIYIMPFRIGEE